MIFFYFATLSTSFDVKQETTCSNIREKWGKMSKTPVTQINFVRSSEHIFFKNDGTYNILVRIRIEQTGIRKIQMKEKKLG